MHAATRGAWAAKRKKTINNGKDKVMGVKTTLAGISLSNTDIQDAEKISADLNGQLEIAEVKCAEVINLLNFIITDILTPAGDSANITTLQNQISALS
jgi:hypothetical protein